MNTLCSNCNLQPAKSKGMCVKCYQSNYNKEVSGGKRKVKTRHKSISCRLCFNDFTSDDKVVKGMHVGCYINTKNWKKRWGFDIDNFKDEFQDHKQEIKCLIIKFKRGYINEIDAFRIAHFFMMFKEQKYIKGDMSEMNIEKQLPRMIKHLERRYLKS